MTAQSFQSLKIALPEPNPALLRSPPFGPY